MVEWLTHTLEPGSYIGMDPKYYGKVEWDALKVALERSNLTLTHVGYTNLIDESWEDRPDCPKDLVKELGIEFSGKSVLTKIEEIHKEMDRERVEVLIVTELDEIACKSIVFHRRQTCHSNLLLHSVKSSNILLNDLHLTHVSNRSSI